MMWPGDVVQHGEKGRHDGQSLDEMALFNRGGAEPVGCRRTAQRVTGTGDFLLRGRRQPRSCSLFSKLNCCQSTKRSAGLGNLTEMRVSSAFSTLARRGFGHHPPTDSAAAGTKVGPGRVASVALHRRPGNTKNDRSIAPVVPFVVVWSCFPLRFTGTTTHLTFPSRPPGSCRPFFRPLSKNQSRPHPHSFTHFAGFRHSFSPTALHLH